MKHYGDITKINGAEAPVVDIITGGSPCQDLSVAGKRAGLAGERSGLFMEQMRIVKEMREHDRANGRTGWAVRPRYMVWENVPGAFSSGNPKGADFAAVIEEIIKVAEPGASVSVCVPNGGWTKSGCYYAEDGSWSIAWRVHDAQFWGVPQRRKRIALVADFGGLSAPEILFERKGLSGDFEQSEQTRQGTADDSEGRIGTSSAISFQERAGKPGGGKGILIQNERTGALSTLNNQSVYAMQSSGDRANPSISVSEEKTFCVPANPMSDRGQFVANGRAVRRLTPLECERLQGYPDGWTDIGEWVDSKGKKHGEADSPRYKALGNSIALPFWQWMAKRISAQYERTPTMASLFDGIGGFPLVFQRCGAVPVWASEIEEFPIAVTKVRLPDESV